MKNVLDYWNLGIDGFKEKVSFKELKDHSDGVAIYLVSEKENSKVLKISFGEALSYRNTNESYLLKVWDETPVEKLGKVFYKVSESSYIDFFNETSFEIYKDWAITHYAIYSSKDCIDVLSLKPPKVEWLSDSELHL